VKLNQKIATLEDGTFSCGVIGRDFEQKAILSLVELLKKEEIEKLEVPVRLTSTNVRVRDIFNELEFKSERLDNEHIKYAANLLDYNPKKRFEWITAHFENPKMEYNGIPSIINFFDKRVKSLMNPNFEVINLGAAQGEVLGHLNENTKKQFYKFIEENNIKYTKIDMEPSQKDGSIYGNAENLSGIIEDKKADIVMALELLEHTEHFWKVIDESNRICKTGGYIILTVPSYHYPKHEYPIDLWRIGPKTLQSFFPKEYFNITNLELEGDKETPRRTMIIAQKIKDYNGKYYMPDTGKINWNNGLTIFP
jgi:2-polyprenyl-3-methyl-5-hydroxy-6-metoxy-1,4-benzoquinol methylase